MGSAGDLGHDAPEAGMQIDLAGHDRREDGGAVGDDGSRRLVARRLDAENEERIYHARGSSMIVRPGIDASMPSRRSAYSSPSTSSAHMTSASSLVSTQ